MSPYRPAHRRRWAGLLRRLRPSDALLAALAALTLLTACFVLGGLAAHPFGL